MKSGTARITLWTPSMTPEAVPIEISHRLPEIGTESMRLGTRAKKFEGSAAELNVHLKACQIA